MDKEAFMQRRASLKAKPEKLWDVIADHRIEEALMLQLINGINDTFSALIFRFFIILNDFSASVRQRIIHGRMMQCKFFKTSISV